MTDEEQQKLIDELDALWVSNRKTSMDLATFALVTVGEELGPEPDYLRLLARLSALVQHAAFRHGALAAMVASGKVDPSILSPGSEHDILRDFKGTVQ